MRNDTSYDSKEARTLTTKWLYPEKTLEPVVSGMLLDSHTTRFEASRRPVTACNGTNDPSMPAFSRNTPLSSPNAYTECVARLLTIELPPLATTAYPAGFKSSGRLTVPSFPDTNIFESDMPIFPLNSPISAEIFTE